MTPLTLISNDDNIKKNQKALTLRHLTPRKVNEWLVLRYISDTPAPVSCRHVR